MSPGLKKPKNCTLTRAVEQRLDRHAAEHRTAHAPDRRCALGLLPLRGAALMILPRIQALGSEVHTPPQRRVTRGHLGYKRSARSGMTR